jgi:hypothetical protein
VRTIDVDSGDAVLVTPYRIGRTPVTMKIIVAERWSAERLERSFAPLGDP